VYLKASSALSNFCDAVFSLANLSELSSSEQLEQVAMTNIQNTNLRTQYEEL
jgi:hypothetical protein